MALSPRICLAGLIAIGGIFSISSDVCAELIQTIDNDAQPSLNKDEKKGLTNSLENKKESQSEIINLPDEIIAPPLELQLQADEQSFDPNRQIFIAKGNVVARLNGAILKAETISFDKAFSSLLATGQVRLIKGSQYFQASSFYYNLINNEGEIKDVYGVLDLQYLGRDARISQINNESNDLLIKESPVSQIQLKDGFDFDGKIGLPSSYANDLGDKPKSSGKLSSYIKTINRTDLIQGSINRWRVQASLITIQPQGWQAKKMAFTNDPFTPSQTRIDAEDVIAKEQEDGSSIITSEKSRLIIEESLNIPTGKRRFGEKKKKPLWIFGIDFKDRDGLFVGRKIKPINLGNQYELSIQPQFMLQRAVSGNTKSYIKSGSSFTSEKVHSAATIYDLFGLKANLNGPIKNWDLDLNANISTLNPLRFMDGSRYWGSVKNSYNIGLLKDVETTLFGAYRYKAWNGSLGETDIYKAYGLYFEKKNRWKFSDITNSSRFRIGLGNYEAEKLYTKDLTNLWRTSFYSSLESTYPIWTGQKAKLTKNAAFRYSPEPIIPRLDFKTKVSNAYFLYENGTSQNTLSIRGGPDLTLGNLDRPIFSYTKISIMPGISLKSGSSPFSFDESIDLKTINFDITQQIFGPLILNGGMEYNIDTDSEYYGKMINSKAELIWQRRAYDLAIFYNPYKGMGGVMFRLNGFDFKGTGRPFLNKQNDLENSDPLIQKSS